MSKNLVNLKAQLKPAELEGVVEVLALPFGVEIEHEGEPISFDADTVVAGDPVPVTIDHGKGSLERIGLATPEKRADGLYASLKISDTAAGRDALTLMGDGVLTDVSAGVERETGALDHIAVVPTGAFGEHGSKVLSVLSKEGSEMGDEKETVEPTPELTELSTEVEGLRALVAELSLPGSKKETAREFDNKREFILTMFDASRGDAAALKKIDEYALADDTTTTAAGVVPDHLSSEVLEIVDTSRPYIDTLHKDDIGSAGMTVDYPRVTQGPVVDVQATEKTEVASQAMTIGISAVPLVTYAGASDVARQLIERSQPSFVDILFRHYANAYSQKTDTDAVAAGVAFAGDTAILADLGADAALTFAAVNDANTAIIAAVRKPATHWCLAADRWAQLNSLVDADGRPLLVYDPNGPSNAQGQSQINTMVAQYHGLVAYLDPNAATGTALIYNAAEYAGILEQAPVQLRAEVVSLLGFELGVYGLFAHAGHQAGAGSTLTLA